MEEQRISIETAKLAQEKGFNVELQFVYDIYEGKNEIVNFKDIAIKDFIEDVETGYRDKAFNYLKEDITRVDNNKDLGYYLLAPTQSQLQRWLRDVHDTHVEVTSHKFKIPQLSPIPRRFVVSINGVISCKGFTNYEDALEHGLLEALKQFNHEKSNIVGSR